MPGDGGARRVEVRGGQSLANSPTSTNRRGRLAAAAEHRQAIRARHRTGKGAWYVALDVMAWDEGHTVGETVETIEERHETRDGAVVAARRLLAEHAHRFDLRFTLSVEVFCELEWMPIRNRKEKAEEEEDGEG